MCIMKVFEQKGFSADDLKRLNKVRLHQQIVFLSCMLGDREIIRHAVHEPKEGRRGLVDNKVFSGEITAKGLPSVKDGTQASCPSGRNLGPPWQADA